MRNIDNDVNRNKEKMLDIVATIIVASSMPKGNPPLVPIVIVFKFIKLYLLGPEIIITWPIHGGKGWGGRGLFLLHIVNPQ